MSAPTEILEIIRLWINKANNDWEAARRIMVDDQGAPYGTACFHCQHSAGRDYSRYHCEYMGLFFVGCRVLNPVTSKSTTVRRLMVDTGPEYTWINATALEAIGIERRKKDLQFQLANGQIITRSVGYAVLTVDKSETVDEVVFAETGDLQLLGARALEGLNLQVDARRKRLVAAGPIVSAAAVPPRFGRLVQVPGGSTEDSREDPSEEAEESSGHQTESSMSDP